MFISLRVKYPFFLSDCNKTWIFSTYFRRIFKYLILWKRVQSEPSTSMRRDEQTNGHDESNSRCLPPWVKLNTARHTSFHFWEVTNMWDFTLPPTCSWGLRPFWDITQRRFLVGCWRFENLENVTSETSVTTTKLRCVTSQKEKA
jgi:hypothetical protein